MPVVEFHGPKLDRSQKERLVSELTRIASEITRVPVQAFVVLIKEDAPENVGVGGELLIHRLAKHD